MEKHRRIFLEIQTLACPEQICAGQWQGECPQPVRVKSYLVPDQILETLKCEQSL